MHSLATVLAAKASFIAGPRRRRPCLVSRDGGHAPVDGLGLPATPVVLKA
jgi:hypothetical protein